MNEVIELFKTREAELLRAQSMLSNVLLGQGYIVVCDGVYLSFKVENGIANHPMPGKAERVTRFTKQDAEAVAAQVRNGRDTVGKAIHVRTAIENELTIVREMLARVGEWNS